MYMIFTAALAWIMRSVLLKATLYILIFSLVVLLGGVAVGYLTPYINTGVLNGAFASIPAGAWYFMDILQMNYGLPLIIGAWVARFLIRRLPIIG